MRKRLQTKTSVLYFTGGWRRWCTDTEFIATASTEPSTSKILREIRTEVREVIRQELQRTLQFYSDKIDEYESKMQLYDKNMKHLENQTWNMRN